MPFIEFKNVSYKVNDKIIINKVDFSVKKGEFIAILGANGSGKSTLAKLINGLILPTEGNILIENMDTKNEKNLDKIRKKIGIVFQNPDNQIVASTVEDDIAFGPENLNISPEEIEKRIDNSLKLVGLTDKRKISPYMLSGGQKQKVAIAGAMAMNTEAIVFDEATSMLDPNSKNEVLNKIWELNKKNNITIIYITHFIEEILNADKIIVINNGEIKETGKLQEIIGNLKNFRIELPFANLVAEKLRENNIKIPQNIYDEKSLINKLKNYKNEDNYVYRN